MKRILNTLIFCAALSMGSSVLLASNPTSSGGLTITADVEPSISLTFNSDTSGVALGVEDSSSTTLDFGTVTAYNTPPTHVTRIVNAAGASASAFSVSTPFKILVMQANGSSLTCSLSATLNTQDTVNTWVLSGVDITDGSSHVINATAAYASATQYTLLVTVPFSSTASVSNSINFVATSN